MDDKASEFQPMAGSSQTYSDQTGAEKAKDRIAGLPVAGYKPTQSPEAIAAVNVFKELEERVLRHIDDLTSAPGNPPFADGRFLAVGRTQLQLAFMALNRAIFQPGRVALPEDAPQELVELDKGSTHGFNSATHEANIGRPPGC